MHHYVSSRCGRCRYRRELCLCPDIPRVDTRTRFLVLRHALETWKPSNTGRLVALALPNSALHPVGERDVPLPEAELAAPGTWLLYPEGPPPPTGAPPPARLVVLDGSWPQARRMAQRIPALRALPRLALPPPPPRPRMRRSSRPAAMATLEAVARAVALLEGEPLAEPLERLYALAVARAGAGARL